MKRNWFWLVAVAVLIGCGDDDDGEACKPGDGAVVMESCSCGDGGTDGQRECLPYGKWGTCSCATPSGQAGSKGNAGTGASGQNGGAGMSSTGNAGTGQDEDDSGVAMTDGATPTPDAGPGPGTDDGGSMLPPATGEQLAPCDGTDENACGDGLVCYRRSFGPGFCTQPCEQDEDCADLTDATYTCSSAGGGSGGMGMCRVECEGEDDTMSCPGDLICIGTSFGGQGGNQGDSFRCGYPAEDQGPPGGGDDGTVETWGACANDNDCAGELVCYGASQGGGNGNGNGNGNGGNDASGFCTSACETTEDCTTPQSSGDIAPTCGGQNLCRFDCAEGGTCPDGMECVQDRCLYSGG